MCLGRCQIAVTSAGGEDGVEEAVLSPVFASRNGIGSLPKFSLPPASSSKEAAYQLVHDELMLERNPRFNLASFVTTWMEPDCDKLIAESLNKNLIDMDEYPVTTELQVCWEKFTNYFAVEMRYVKTREGYYILGSIQGYGLGG